METSTQEWTAEESREAIRQVIKKVMTDADFRRKALNDANGAVEAVAGKTLPEGYNLSFVDQAGADMTVVLPDSGTKLSTADLDKVVGGGLSARSTPARPSAGAGQKSITVDEILFDPY